MARRPEHTFAVIHCQNCQKEIGLATATGRTMEMLADPFEAKCPYCGDQSTYRHSSIFVRVKE